MIEDRLMWHATRPFVEMIYLAACDPRSQGRAVCITNQAAADYFRSHESGIAWSEPVTADTNLSGNFAANLDGKRWTELARSQSDVLDLVRRVPTNGSPQAWEILDFDAAGRMLGVARSRGSELDVRLRSGFAVVYARNEPDESVQPRSGPDLPLLAFEPFEPQNVPSLPEHDDVDLRSAFDELRRLSDGTQRHEDLRRHVADVVREAGCEVLQGAPAQLRPDVAWLCDVGMVVAELKTSGPRSRDDQLRLGLGQVLQYRWAARDQQVGPVHALLIIDEPPGPNWPSVCEAVDVLLAHRADLAGSLAPLLIPARISSEERPQL